MSGEIGLKWNDYKDQSPDEAAQAIHAYIGARAASIVDWYWAAIKSKRRAALVVRGIAFALLIAGAVAQVYAGSFDEAKARLQFTQGSLALLAVGALLLQGDRSFGWTSGWTRYITTAMTMETLVSEFRLKWAKLQMACGSGLTHDNVATLFELACALETHLLKARDEETAAWAAEFHAGLQLLESAVRSQRETTEKKLAELRAQVEQQVEGAGKRAPARRRRPPRSRERTA